MGMLKTFGAALSIILYGCMAPYDDIGQLRFVPDGETDIMALVPVGPAVGGPFASVDCPVDGSPILALDIRRPTAALLRNDEWVTKEREVEYAFAEEGVGPTFVIGPPNLFNSATYVDSKVVLEIPDCQVDDDIKIMAWGDWQLNTASNPSVVGRARIEITEDIDGAPLVVPNVYGKASIVTPGGGALPHVSNYVLHIKHRVTTAGKTKVALQVAYEDLTGGAGTATIILQLSARMDITHVSRNLP